MSHLSALYVVVLNFSEHEFPKKRIELDRRGLSASCPISVPPVPESCPEVVAAGQESCMGGRVNHPPHLKKIRYTVTPKVPKNGCRI